jgi:hypothetical protein
MKNKLYFFLLFSFTNNLYAQPFQKLTHVIGLVDTVEGVGSSPQNFGFGITFYDFNVDGFDDLSIATGNNRPVLFYQNDGNGGFYKIFPTGDILNQSNEQKNILWADIDNDGDKDCFISGFQSQNRLYRNDGNLHMVDITFDAGLLMLEDWTYGASIGDINNDGLLDIYVCNRRSNINTNYLYLNNGNNTFSEIGGPSGTSDGFRLSFQSGIFDYNNDGYQDIYVANDRSYRNSLYKNNGDGATFTDISEESGAGLLMDAMNVGIGDYDNDGYYDIYITNKDSNINLSDNVLLHNNQNGTFSNLADDTNTAFEGVQNSWAANFFDFDNDTDEDIFVVTSDPGIGSNNSILVNQLAETGQSVFSNYWPAGLEYDLPSNSQSIGDFDNDGLLDIILPFKGEDTIALYRNTLTNNNNWVKFNLEGTYSNRDGIGSKIELWVGNSRYSRYRRCGESYLCQNSGYIHFGLGTATQIDSVHITWLSGIVDVIYNPGINQVLSVVEGTQNATILIKTSTTSANCEIGNDGTAQAKVTGNYDFQYLWNTGDSTSFIDNLIPGDYQVTVSLNGITGVAIAHVGVIPGGTEIPNNDTDENCDGLLEFTDTDNDGFSFDLDCNDNDPGINPGVAEIPNNDIDENCDNLALIIDMDNDGFNSDEDCNDEDSAINPSALEIVNNQIDENCDGFLLIIDIDNDGYNSDEDCNDNVPEINPGLNEIPNNDIDENCDGIILIIDTDADGYNSDEDCNDNDPETNPGASEIPNNDIDENCDGDILIIDLDNDGYNSDEDCDDLNPLINPGAAEISGNSVDEDCDGEILVANNHINDIATVIYPNPAGDQLFVVCSFEIKSVKLYDLTGRKYIPELIENKVNEIKINVSVLPAGIYYLEVVENLQHTGYYKKFIKM